MLKYIRITSLVIIYCGCSAQDINFNSYDKIVSQEFRNFVELFKKKDLPLSTDSLIKHDVLSTANKKPLPLELVLKYLTKKGEKVPITGSLYLEQSESFAEAIPVIGKFYPLFKLPTNGDYVLLVFAQLDDKGNKDCVGLAFTLSYDLNGNYLYFSNYTYRPGTENVNAIIDKKLHSHLIYVINEVNGKHTFPPITGSFSAIRGHLISRIKPDGKSEKVAFTKNKKVFQFFQQECRFKEISE